MKNLQKCKERGNIFDRSVESTDNISRYSNNKILRSEWEIISWTIDRSQIKTKIQLWKINRINGDQSNAFVIYFQTLSFLFLRKHEIVSLLIADTNVSPFSFYLDLEKKIHLEG